MTKEEAIKEMREGKKVTHRYFSPDEWMTMKDGEIVLEDGVRCHPYDFWNWRTEKSWHDGYSIWN
jgi:hypothetical protein